jgi:ferrous iron transport protein A
MNIQELHIGDQAEIVSLDKQDPVIRQKLLALGLIPGTPFTLVRKAPLGDPIQISVRNFSLMLRQNEAKILVVKKLS